MESQPPKTAKYALNYGLILGGLGIVFSLMLYFMDMHYQQGWANTVVAIAIMIFVLILAIIQFKKANGGFLSLAQALKVGIGAALVGGIISVLYTLIFTNVIEPDFWDKSLEMSKPIMAERNPKLTPEQIDNALETQRKFMWVTYPFILIFNLFIGFVISLISGLALKKAESEY